MIDLSNEPVVPAKQERNVALKQEITETLAAMEIGVSSFAIEGKIRKGTVRAVAKKAGYKVRFIKSETGLRCIRTA